jgi:hypothetical protein
MPIVVGPTARSPLRAAPLLGPTAPTRCPTPHYPLPTTHYPLPASTPDAAADPVGIPPPPAGLFLGCGLIGGCTFGGPFDSSRPGPSARPIDFLIEMGPTAPRPRPTPIKQCPVFSGPSYFSAWLTTCPAPTTGQPLAPQIPATRNVRARRITPRAI